MRTAILAITNSPLKRGQKVVVCVVLAPGLTRNPTLRLSADKDGKRSSANHIFNDLRPGFRTRQVISECSPIPTIGGCSRVIRIESGSGASAQSIAKTMIAAIPSATPVGTPGVGSKATASPHPATNPDAGPRTTGIRPRELNWEPVPKP